MKRIVQSVVLIALTAILAYPLTVQNSSKLEEVTKAGNAAIAAGDWARAESFLKSRGLTRAALSLGVSISDDRLKRPSRLISDAGRRLVWRERDGNLFG